MYRLILLLTLLGTGHCSWGWFDHDHDDYDEGYHNGHDHEGGHDHRHHHGDWHGHRRHHSRQSPDEHKFNKLSAYVIKADRYANHFCEHHRNCEVKELYGNSTYKLVYTIPSAHVDNTAVKIKHRVIYVYARQTGVDKPQTFIDVRILPNRLKIEDALYQYKTDHLIVMIPYNTTPGTETKCADVSEDVITVSYAPAIDFRFDIPKSDGKM